MSDPNQILNITEAAEFLGISTFSLRNFIKEGQLPAFRVGRQWRFIRGDLIAHLRMQYTKKDDAPANQV